MRHLILPTALDNCLIGISVSDGAANWVEAGKIAAGDLNARILCPVCRSAHLEIWDVVRRRSNHQRERHMCCPNCGSQNSLRISEE